MQLAIPDEVVEALRVPEAEAETRLRQELALALYAQGIIGFGKARSLACLSVLEFGLLLGRRGIPRQYGEDELREDLDYARRQ